MCWAAVHHVLGRGTDMEISREDGDLPWFPFGRTAVECAYLTWPILTTPSEIEASSKN